MCSMRYLSLFLLPFLTSMSLWAQFAAHAVVRGELQIEGAGAGQDYQVELADCSGGSQVIRGRMSSGNRFEFEDVSPGCKVLRVVNATQRTIVQEVQIFAEAGTPVVIPVTTPEKEQVKARTISVERLRHPVPEKAARVLGEANRLWQAGRERKRATSFVRGSRSIRTFGNCNSISESSR